MGMVIRSTSQQESVLCAKVVVGMEEEMGDGVGNQR